MSTEHKSIEQESFSTTHVPTAALASALGGHLVRTITDPTTGRLLVPTWPLNSTRAATPARAFRSGRSSTSRWTR